MRYRKMILSLLLATASMAICFLFWRIELVYSLPTPIPVNYKPVSTGTNIAIPAGLYTTSRKPLFLHFFNPDCPCSKFNISYFKRLLKQYHTQANFAIVVMSNKKYTEHELQEKFRLDIPVLFDTALAVSCGVYSTPQAVLIDQRNNLYYRGNYNRSRYCTDKKSNYAEQALENLLSSNTRASFNPYALIAYGCSLPTCRNNQTSR